MHRADNAIHGRPGRLQGQYGVNPAASTEQPQARRAAALALQAVTLSFKRETQHLDESPSISFERRPTEARTNPKVGGVVDLKPALTSQTRQQGYSHNRQSSEPFLKSSENHLSNTLAHTGGMPFNSSIPTRESGERQFSSKKSTKQESSSTLHMHKGSLQMPNSDITLDIEKAAAAVTSVLQDMSLLDRATYEPLKPLYQSIATPVTRSPRKVHADVQNEEGDGSNGKGMQASLASVAESLEKAATALRLLVPVTLNTEATMDESDKHTYTQPPGVVRASGAWSRKTGVSASTSPGEGTSFQVMDGDGHLLFEPTVRQLIHANQSLQDAFKKADQRISTLEDEKWRFSDEGVFDIVNSAALQRSGFNHLNLSRSMPLSTLDSVDDNAMKSSLILSPQKKMEAHTREDDVLRSNAVLLSPLLLKKLDTRSAAEISIENRELRSELAYANEVGDRLELKKRNAEERHQFLLQERVWLADRLQRYQAVSQPINNVSAQTGNPGGDVQNILRQLSMSSNETEVDGEHLSEQEFSYEEESHLAQIRLDAALAVGHPCQEDAWWHSKSDHMILSSNMDDTCPLEPQSRNNMLSMDSHFMFEPFELEDSW